MVEDFWPTLHADPYALARLKKSVELLDCKPGLAVLDVGCHQEEARRFLPSCYYLGLDHIKGDDFDGGFSIPRKFDRILCLEVLEHLKFPKKTLESICDHLKDDGIVVVSLPNEASFFHRIRSFLGTPDAEAFSECGKHLHLPNLKQARNLLREGNLDILNQSNYISSAASSRQAWIEHILKLFPDSFWQFLADSLPSLFARGFIFVCKKK